jgi:hypothetical protein
MSYSFAFRRRAQGAQRKNFLSGDRKLGALLKEVDVIDRLLVENSRSAVVSVGDLPLLLGFNEGQACHSQWLCRESGADRIRAAMLESRPTTLDRNQLVGGT